MTRIRILTAVGLLLPLSFSSAPRAQDSPLLSAMEDEMQRSMAELRLPGEPAPYDPEVLLATLQKAALAAQ